MSAIQQSFSIRLSSGVKTVHLLGSWDNYVGQLPLSKDKTSSKGTWKGTFRFGNSTLEAGQRYWYYFIIDGYHVSHNPSESSTVEATTGRELNILDVPKSSKSSSKDKSSKTSRESRHASSKDKSHKRPSTLDIPKGRPLSTSQIKAPKPQAPHATRHILDGDYDCDELAEHLASTGLDGYYEEDIITDFASASPVSSTDSDLSYRSDSSSPNSSMSGYSTPGSECSSCTCERYGITRKGERVRIDCHGARCGSEDSCSSSESDGEYTSSRRNGIVVRS